VRDAIGAVVLAAGAGRRMGGVAKALLERDGVTYLARIAATAREVGLVDAVVVVGPPFGDAVAAHARELGLRTVVNPTPERGMASSIALGFAAIAESSATAAWLWPVDHPDVTARTLHALVDARGAHEVARPRFHGRGGHPPLVSREVWPRLVGCANTDGGARTVLGAADVAEVEVDDEGVVRDHDEVRS
jgi:CTP:molybdopterin cytidylyltransferase MocA